MNIAFYLDKPSAPKTTLMVDVAFDGERPRFSSGLAISPAYWNHDRQQIRATDPQRVAHQQRLDRVEAIAKEVYEQMNLGAVGRIVTEADAEEYKKRVKARIKPVKPGAKSKVVTTSTEAITSDFFGHYQEFVKTYTITTRTGQVTTKRPSDVTLEQYRRCGKILREYSAKQNVMLTFENINMDFYRKFTEWLATEKDRLDSTVGNYVKNIKAFMKWAMDDERQLHSNIAFMKFYRATSDENERGIALTLPELRLFRDADLSHNEALQKARDRHLLQTFTALRYSDLELLEPMNFDLKNKFIVSPVKKTGSKGVVIPIIPSCETLLASNPSLQFECPSTRQQNSYLKEIGKLIGLDAPVIVREHRRGKRIERVVPKWQQFSTHSARRTFMTLSIEDFGLSEQIVCRVTGHKPANRVAAGYFKASREGIRTAVCNAWAAF